MKRYISICALLLSIAAVSCTDDILEPNDNIIEDGVPYITAVIDNGADNQGETKTALIYDNRHLKASWIAGDRICVTPIKYETYNGTDYTAHYIFSKKLYRYNSDSKVFDAEDGGVSSSFGLYAFFYPGDKVYSYPSFTRFTYDGQVQDKNAPMDHLGEYQCMMAEGTSGNNIRFESGNGYMSACMHFQLSGIEFDSPVRIELSSLNGTSFCLNNVCNESYVYYSNDVPDDDQNTSTLALDLKGYGKVSKLDAWMMMSNRDVRLSRGETLRVTVQCADGSAYYSDITLNSALTLKGGRCHTIAISKNWEARVGDYTNYPWDGEVVTLQDGTSDGLDIVIMGDGFIKEDFDNGTYHEIMLQAYNEFFSVEPYSTLRPYFNVFYIKTPSPERTQATTTGANGAINNGHVTKFGCQFTPYSTSLKGDDDLARNYALKAFDKNASERIKDATIVVVANQECRAGTCWTSWYTNNGKDYGQANSVAYCALGTNSEERVEIMHHEICGHGFGKLADEYQGQNVTSTQPMNELRSFHNDGLYRNVDVCIDENISSQIGWAVTTRNDVLWHDLFNKTNDYENTEGLGMYKGAYTYNNGFCRPTENAFHSIMNYNTGIFNAISRRQIYYRVRRLSGELNTNCFGSETELKDFLKWDAEVIMPKLPDVKRMQVRQRTGIGVSETVLPLGNPVLVSGHWEKGRFVKD